MHEIRFAEYRFFRLKNINDRCFPLALLGQHPNLCFGFCKNIVKYLKIPWNEEKRFRNNVCCWKYYSMIFTLLTLLRMFAYLREIKVRKNVQCVQYEKYYTIHPKQRRQRERIVKGKILEFHERNPKMRYRRGRIFKGWIVSLFKYLHFFDYLRKVKHRSWWKPCRHLLQLLRESS